MARVLSMLTWRSRPSGEIRFASAPGFGGHDDLIEVEGARIHSDEADHFSVGFGHRDGRDRYELEPPPLAPPVYPRGKIDPRIGELPSAQPQRDCRVLVGGRIRPQR